MTVRTIVCTTYGSKKYPEYNSCITPNDDIRKINMQTDDTSHYKAAIFTNCIFLKLILNREIITGSGFCYDFGILESISITLLSIFKPRWRCPNF